MKKLLNNIGSFLMLVICGFALFLFANSAYQTSNRAVIPMTFGWGTATVVSGSMEPGIPVGSMVLIQEQPEYQPGDVIAYANENGQAITHRIVSINDETVITRGDSNNVADPAFPADRIIGKIRFVLPSVGAVLVFMKQPVVLGSLAFISLVIFFLPGPHKKKAPAKEAAADQDAEEVEAPAIDETSVG